ncbi:Uncharacterized protein Fot_28897 [Forsythia ovata]|uniref:Uncharacterized protein n=1 Tax=Forsythia ovata TaxID=205694 RepID=A0ABD1TQB5_9LAMI
MVPFQSDKKCDFAIGCQWFIPPLLSKSQRPRLHLREYPPSVNELFPTTSSGSTIVSNNLERLVNNEPVYHSFQVDRPGSGNGISERVREAADTVSPEDDTVLPEEMVAFLITNMLRAHVLSFEMIKKYLGSAQKR